MKPHFKLAVLIAIILIGSCKKDAFIPRSTLITKSLQDYYERNKPKPEIHFVDGVNGGSFTTAQGTTVSIPPNAFMDQFGNPVTGVVTIEFLDVYKKSDMLWTGMTTQMNTGEPLKSGGEFFIKAAVNGVPVALNGNGPIDVMQPLNNEPLDTAMAPFIANDSANGNGWSNSWTASVSYNTSQYIFSLYQFNSPLDSGSWCNSDNAAFFSAYTQSPLTIHFTGTVSDYHPDVYLVFNDINSMIHVYPDYFGNGSNFLYSYAPVGLSCTVVAIGEKDDKLYSSFTPIIIGANQTVNFNLNETTEADFKTALEALN